MIVCDGSQRSNSAYGTTFVHYGAGDCFVWDGSGAANAGTGGGLKDCLIVKADGHQGGTAIKVIATDDDHRPGEMVFDNVLVYGVGRTPGKFGMGGLWSRCAVFDRTACNTAGARGVRSIHLRKLRCAEAMIANETVLTNQVTHFFSFGLAVDKGDAMVAQGVTLKGINDGIYICGSSISGTFTIVANDVSNSTSNFELTGKVGGSFRNNDSLLTGVASIVNSGYTLVNKSKKLRIQAPTTPTFLLTLDSSSLNQTGDGTIFTVSFDTLQYDDGGNLSAGAKGFTCFCAGTYSFDFGVTLAGIDQAHKRTDIGIFQTGSAVRSIVKVSNPFSQAASGYLSENISANLQLAYGDVVQCRVSVTGGTRTVSVYGVNPTTYTFFNGKYEGA